MQRIRACWDAFSKGRMYGHPSLRPRLIRSHLSALYNLVSYIHIATTCSFRSSFILSGGRALLAEIYITWFCLILNFAPI